MDAVAAPHKALFLDRDGVINIDHGYVHRPDQVEFCPGIFDLVRQARERGYAVVVVTNQAVSGKAGKATKDCLTNYCRSETRQEFRLNTDPKVLTTFAPVIAYTYYRTVLSWRMAKLDDDKCNLSTCEGVSSFNG